MCYVALPCCLLDLTCFFLPSFSSLIKTCIYRPSLPQTIMPLGVATAMSGIRRTSFFIPSPTAFSRSALNTVGILSVTPGCYPHVLQVSHFSVRACACDTKLCICNVPPLSLSVYTCRLPYYYNSCRVDWLIIFSRAP